MTDRIPLAHEQLSSVKIGIDGIPSCMVLILRETKRITFQWKDPIYGA
ncbi:MAG: hypothetical protein NTV09_07440 [Bacteroidetes bacterium]|nr:hypothetical protein [Bacteroidota bacterium]